MSSKSSQLAKVLHTERAVVDGTPVTRVIVDAGDGDGGEGETAELVLPPGVDALPLPGDEVQIDDTEGQGSWSCCSFADPKNQGKALEGEHRTFARDDAGELVCEVWLKKDGTIVLKSVKSGAKLDLNGVLIDQQGNAIFPGDVTIMAVDAASPSPSAVKLSTHLHGTGVGPTTAPTPGT